MALGVINRDGGTTSEVGLDRFGMQAFTGNIIDGFAVGQRGAGANMSVDISAGDGKIDNSNNYSYGIFNDATYNLTIPTSDPSNPRRDIIAAYIDMAQSPNPAINENTNGVLKIKVVQGTAAGSPVDPNGAAIQSSVGSGNPYTILGRVRVGAGVTTITTSVIDDLRTFVVAAGASTDGWRAATDTWTYASATTFTIAGLDRTAMFPVGTKLKLTQTTAKYFYVTASSFSTNTTVTVTGGSDYSLANAAITSPLYSYVTTPQGFPGWFSWTPTFTNFTVGNGTHASKFFMNGKSVLYKMIFTLGSTSSVSSGPTFSLPVTTVSHPANYPMGQGVIQDTGSNTYNAYAQYNSTTISSIFFWNLNNNAGNVDSSNPMSWGNTDTIWLNGQYEAA